MPFYFTDLSVHGELEIWKKIGILKKIYQANSKQENTDISFPKAK